ILNLKKIPWIKGIGISRSESQNLMNTLTIRVDKETHRSAAHLCRFDLTNRCLNVKAVQGHRSPRMLRIKTLKFLNVA
ncbi:MAG: hypothetical protein NT118_02590, partial [Lentisphaerae bacterium]|nr:hypothetical protein [Lentisphaerota bacterium]